jgi:hypothetical protein
LVGFSLSFDRYWPYDGGVGYYALGKLYEIIKRVNWLAIAVGTANIATATLLIIMHYLYFSDPLLLNNMSYVIKAGFWLLILSLAM